MDNGSKKPAPFLKNMTVSTHHTNEPKEAKPSSKRKKVARYFLLPGIVPQMRELTRGGFGYLAFLIALVYQAVRILPANHPYGRYENIGKFGIRQVVAMAANNVKFTKKNIDQIIIFFAIIAALIILTLQFIGFIIMLLTGQAWAQELDPNSFGGIFSTQNESTDIAFYMMRQVFGLPDMFGPLEGGPTSLHLALQAMFQFYNIAILIVAILVFVYYVVVVVAETASTGTPFGQRFSHIYAPLRLVLAIGLLVPLNYGFNGAQYLTFYAAKLGSGFATTGWSEFNNSLAESNPLGADNATLIAKPSKPDVDALVQFMAVAVTCREAYKMQENIEIVGAVEFGLEGNNYLEFDTSALWTMSDANWTQDIKILFGIEGEEPDENFIPVCGEIIVPVNLALQGDLSEFYPGELQERYFILTNHLWLDFDLEELGKEFATYFAIDPPLLKAAGIQLPNRSKQDTALSDARTYLETSLLIFDEDMRAGLESNIKQETLNLGWGGAGIWYNRIAQMNGAYVVAVRNLPDPKAMPIVMEHVVEQKRLNDQTVSGCEAYEPNIGGSPNAIEFDNGATDLYYAKVLDAAHQYWTCHNVRESNNFVLDIASAIFGLDGLLAIRDRVETGETGPDGQALYTEIHPLAKLSALGKGLIESAIRNMTFGIATAFIGGLASATPFGAAFQAFTSMFVSIATIALSIGFITYYILPFLPFIYFFFALGNWVKSIFEAMVGAPLWALAHLRIDGDGLPGKNAVNGYLLIFEIFLRPILTVFGLIGGMAIFTTLAAVINEIFNIVVKVGSGVDLQTEDQGAISMSTVDVFFFTTVYAVVLYMMATASFKMINLVPNSILRWFGNSVTAFSDNADDPTSGLTQYAAIGGAQIGGQLASGITQGAQGVGTAIQALPAAAAGAGRPTQ